MRAGSAFSGSVPSLVMASGYFSGWDISTKSARSLLNIDRDQASGLSLSK